MCRISHLLLGLVIAPAVFGQPNPRTEEALRKSGLRVAVAPSGARNSREFRLRLLSTPGARAASLSIVQRIDRSDPPPKQRSSEISSDHLVVAVLDAQGTVRYWKIVLDPRLVRGEFPDAFGNLRKSVEYRNDAPLSVSVPVGIDAAEVRILSPSWESGELKLVPLAEVNVPAGERR